MDLIDSLQNIELATTSECTVCLFGSQPSRVVWLEYFYLSWWGRERPRPTPYQYEASLYLMLNRRSQGVYYHPHFNFHECSREVEGLVVELIFQLGATNKAKKEVLTNESSGENMTMTMQIRSSSLLVHYFVVVAMVASSS